MFLSPAIPVDMDCRRSLEERIERCGFTEVDPLILEYMRCQDEVTQRPRLVLASFRNYITSHQVLARLRAKRYRPGGLAHLLAFLESPIAREPQFDDTLFVELQDSLKLRRWRHSRIVTSYQLGFVPKKTLELSRLECIEWGIACKFIAVAP